MIRPATPADTAAILTLAISSGMFPPDGTDELAGVLADSLAGRLGPDHVWVTDDDSGPVGVAYYAPERMTEGTWNLYMIAVSPLNQRQGRGSDILRYVEQDLGGPRRPAIAGRNLRVGELRENSGFLPHVRI